MRTEIMLAAIGGLVAIGVPTVGQLPATPDAPTQGGDFRWTGRLAAGQTLEIRGINGQVRVDAASGNEAEVLATKRGRRSDPADVEIAVVPHDGGVTICAVYPPVNGRENECLPGGGGRNNSKDNDVQVEWTVHLPNGVNLGAHTVNGDVAVRDVSGEVQASSVNGDVDVSTRGVAEASTVNGSIHASLGKADWTGTMRFTTVNGGITLEVPGDLSAEIEARTVNGSIETDFPIMVRGRFGSRTLRGTIGGGGRDLELETVNGSISLRKTS
jgi:DUF4097 and DUF4098 domain-containing protein YvlB